MDKPVEQFKKFDPASPAKPTPKHLQRHIRNESMRFPSGDFSNITITPRKSITVESEIKVDKSSVETKITKDVISQKEKVSSKVEEKIEDEQRSPDLVNEEEKDIAEKTLKDKISTFESKLLKETSIELPKTTVKLTKEALKKHTEEHDQSFEYTQEFVREQSKQISDFVIKEDTYTETVKSVKETIQQFDSKIKEEKTRQIHKTARTDSTLVQVSSEEDSEFLKKSTDSETETESQTTIKGEKERIKKKEQIITEFSEDLSKKDLIKSNLDATDFKDFKISRDDEFKKDEDAIPVKTELNIIKEQKIIQEEIEQSTSNKVSKIIYVYIFVCFLILFFVLNSSD